MAVNDEFKLKLSIDSSQAVGGFDSITESVDDFSDEIEASQLSLDKISGAFGRMSVGVIAVNQAVQLASSAFDQLSKAVSFTAGASVSLQSSVAEINTLLDDQSLKISTVTQDILELQSQFGGSQADIAESYYNSLSAGVSDVSTSLEFLQSAQKLAIGGVTTLNTAVGGLSTIMRAYSLDASDTASVSDALFIAMKFGRTTIGELSNTLGAIAGPAATMGIKFTELAAAVANVATVTGDTNRAVTSVRSAVVALARPTESLKSLWGQISTVTIEAAIAQDGLVTTLERISDAAGGSTTALIDLFGSTEALPAITALTSNAINETFRKTLEEMGIAAQDAGKVTEEAFMKIAGTVQFQANLIQGNVQSSFTEIGLSLLEALLPAFRSIGEMIKDIASLIVSFSNAFQKLDVAPFVAMLAGLVAAIKLVSIAWISFQAALSMSAATGGVITVLDALILKTNAFAFSLGVATAKLKIFALAGLKVAAMSIGLVTIAVSLELIIRNLKDFETLAEIALVSIATGFLNLNQAITLARLKFLEFSNLGGINDDKIKELEEDFVSSQETIEKNQEALEAMTKTLDTGFSGRAIESIIDALSSVGDEQKDQKENLEQIAAKERERLEALRQQRLEVEAQNTLLGKMDELNSKSLSSAKNAVRLLEFNTILQLKKISKLEEELKATKGLTAEQRKQSKEIIARARANAKSEELLKIEQLRLNLTKSRLNQELGIERTGLRILNLKKENSDSDENQLSIIETQLSISQKVLDNYLLQKFASKEIRKRAEENVSFLREQLKIQAELARTEITGITFGDVLDDLKEAFSKKNFKKMGENAEAMWQSTKDFADNFSSGEKFSAFGDQIKKSWDEADISGAIGDAFKSINLTDLGDALKKMAMFAFEGITAMFSPDAIGALADGIENSLVKLPQMLIEAWSKLSLVLTQFIETFPDALMKMLDMLPQILQAVLDKLPAFIRVLMDAFIQVLTKIPEMVSQIVEKIPELLVIILDKLPEVIDRLFEVIPQVFILLISKIPQIITDILDRLPKILERLIAGLIGGAGEMAVAFTEMLIVNMPDIIAALIKAIPKLVVALVNGIAIGLKRVFGALFKGVKMPKSNAKAIADDMLKTVAKTFSGAGISEDLFSLVDLGGAPKQKKGDEKDAENESIIQRMEAASNSFWENFSIAWVKFRDGVTQFFTLFGKALTELGSILSDAIFAIGNAIIEGFRWVIDTLLKPILDGIVYVLTEIFTGVVNFVKRIPMLLSEAWIGLKEFFTKDLPLIFTTIWEGFTGAIVAAFTLAIDIITGVFTWVKEKIFDPIGNALMTSFTWIHENVFNPLVSGIKTVFESVTLALSNVFDAVAEIFEPIISGFETFIAGVVSVFAPILDAVDAVSGGGGGALDKAEGYLSDRGITFSEGGPINRGIPLKSLGIKGYASGGAIDDRLIAAQTGEFMFKKSTVDSIGTGTLNAINKSGSLPNTGGGGNTTINISDGAIQVTGADDPQRVVDDILEEIKRRSLDGEFLMSNQGLL